MEAAEIPEIEIDELEQHLDEGAALFDVRETDEYQDGHIPGAVHVPLATVADSLARIQSDAADGQAFCVCAKGGRSAQAVGLLRSHGVNAVNVAGGTEAWRLSGRPLEA